MEWALHEGQMGTAEVSHMIRMKNVEMDVLNLIESTLYGNNQQASLTFETSRVVQIYDLDAHLVETKDSKI